jgi:hypothetical protein
MYCQECGTEMDSPLAACPKCGWRDPSKRGLGLDETQLSTYLVQSILATIFCCLPFGIVAIAYATQVEGKQRAGDFEGAVLASNAARAWCWVAFGSGVFLILLWLITAAIH